MHCANCGGNNLARGDTTLRAEGNEMKLPEPDTHCFDDDTQTDVWSYSKELMVGMYKQALLDGASHLEKVEYGNPSFLLREMAKEIDND